jgi:hypothetical protein
VKTFEAQSAQAARHGIADSRVTAEFSHSSRGFNWSSIQPESAQRGLSLDERGARITAAKNAITTTATGMMRNRIGDLLEGRLIRM